MYKKAKRRIYNRILFYISKRKVYNASRTLIYRISRNDNGTYNSDAGSAKNAWKKTPKLVVNKYIVKKKSFEIMMNQILYNAEAGSQKVVA